MNHINKSQSNSQGWPAVFAACSYEFGQFCLDANRRLLQKDGAVIRLRPKAVEVLLALVERRDRVVETDELMDLLWPEQISVEENNLTFHISVLRRALGETPRDHRYVLTIPRRGYRFVADVKELANGFVTRQSEQIAGDHPVAQSANFTFVSVAAGNHFKSQNRYGTGSPPTCINGNASLIFKLFVRDLEHSISFYLKLGFTPARLESQFAELCLGGLRIFLEQSDQLFLLPPKPVGSLCVLVADVDAIRVKVRQHSLPVIKEIGDRENGMRDFTVMGPDGVALHFVTTLAATKTIPHVVKQARC